MAKSIAWYGESGSFKSTQLIFIAKYIYKKTGKKTRVVLTDSSAGDMLKPCEQAGIMDVWRISALENPLTVMRLLAQGRWPVAKVKDGKTILEMVAPTQETWKEIGAICLDSMTTFCDLAMADLLGKGQKIAEDVVSQFSESVMGENGIQQTIRFGAAARAHYNFIQNQVYNIINSASSLPIELFGMTLLEAKAEEQDRSTIYGPAIIGKAATPKFPAWVGALLHFDSTMVPVVTMKTVIVDGKATQVAETVYQTQVRAYFMRHPDPKTGVNHPAKPRVPPEKFADLLKIFPGGYFIPTTEGGIDLFMEAEEKLLDESKDGLKSWREQVDAQRKGTAAK